MKLKSGDLVKAEIPGVDGIHICIILDDHEINNHSKCLPVCNFTGSPVRSGEFAIDISKFDLPDSWFENKKPNSWIRCNEIDCIYAFNLIDKKVIGNIKTDFNDLWLEVCEKTKSCPISARLNTTCACEYKVIQRMVDQGKIAKPDCGCNT